MGGLLSAKQWEVTRNAVRNTAGARLKDLKSLVVPAHQSAEIQGAGFAGEAVSCSIRPRWAGKTIEVEAGLPASSEDSKARSRMAVTIYPNSTLVFSLPQESGQPDRRRVLFVTVAPL